MPKSSHNPYFEIRRSPIQGRGAFARRQIRKGTRIIEYTGERVSHEEADRRYDDEHMARHHTFLFTLDRKTCLDAAVNGNDARYINHSCDPNCEAVIDDGHIWIEALRAIAPGDELVYDCQYEREDAAGEDDEAMYPCRCGSYKCRGTILAPRKHTKRTAGAPRRGAQRKA